MATLPSSATPAATRLVPPPGATSQIGRTPRLDKLKAQARKPGEASFFFYDAHFKNEAVKVLPGEYYCDNEDLLVMTTLGLVHRHRLHCRCWL